MLKIIVGDAWPGVREDLEPDMWRLMPADLVQHFKVTLERRKGVDTTVRVYTDTIINYVGEMIELGEIDPAEVQVITDKGIHTFTSEGVLDKTWPFGIFNY